MTKTRVYEVRADSINYRHLSFESSWKAASPFLYGKPLNEIGELSFRYLTLEEDVADEEELMADEDGGDPELARRRFETGSADCAYVLGFVTTLVLSSRAKEELAATLDATGQVFPVEVDGDTFFVFNCTRLLNAVDAEGTEVRFVGDGRPSQFTQLSFKDEAIQDETLFKARWPEPEETGGEVDYLQIPPPTQIFCTQKFVDMVRENGLRGFQFKVVC
jgi:hypothetical protein